jgi:hypothetical protein
MDWMENGLRKDNDRIQNGLDWFENGSEKGSKRGLDWIGLDWIGLGGWWIRED